MMVQRYFTTTTTITTTTIIRVVTLLVNDASTVMTANRRHHHRRRTQVAASGYSPGAQNVQYIRAPPPGADARGVPNPSGMPQAEYVAMVPVTAPGQGNVYYHEQHVVMPGDPSAPGRYIYYSDAPSQPETGFQQQQQPSTQMPTPTPPRYDDYREKGGGGGRREKGEGRRAKGRSPDRDRDRSPPPRVDRGGRSGRDARDRSPPDRRGERKKGSGKSVSLLDEFRNSGKGRHWDLNDLAGNIVQFCQDQHGSRFIQQKLEAASLAEKQMIFNEIMPHAHDLMIDVFGEFGLLPFRDQLPRQLVLT